MSAPDAAWLRLIPILAGLILVGGLFLLVRRSSRQQTRHQEAGAEPLGDTTGWRLP